MNMTVIAEGVETHAQLDLVRAVGCDNIQGFLVARPQLDQDFLHTMVELANAASARLL
jgi:EAL domain-containing protein (putative c-di-GMP-specific phosphodiesterase class I)